MNFRRRHPLGASGGVAAKRARSSLRERVKGLTSNGANQCWWCGGGVDEIWADPEGLVPREKAPRRASLKAAYRRDS